MRMFIILPENSLFSRFKRNENILEIRKFPLRGVISKFSRSDSKNQASANRNSSVWETNGPKDSFGEGEVKIRFMHHIIN